MSYFFSEGARVEHLEHIAYYEEQRIGLGARDLSAFEAAMVNVVKIQICFALNLLPVSGGVEYRGFPYNILYRQSGTEIEVLVVAPHRRRPGYWLGRL